MFIVYSTYVAGRGNIDGEIRPNGPQLIYDRERHRSFRNFDDAVKWCRQQKIVPEMPLYIEGSRKGETCSLYFNNGKTEKFL